MRRKYSNMTEACRSLSEAGYTASFVLEETNLLRCIETGELLSAEQLKIVDSFRFEGSSNPDDMAVLYVIEAASGTKGLIIDAFGPYAGSDLGELLESIEVERTGTDAVPAVLSASGPHQAEGQKGV